MDDLAQRARPAEAEAAFAEVVRRYATLVYSSAQRQVRDASLAEDVAQAVFLVLWKRWGRVRGELLAGWLLRATWYASKRAMRSAGRRQKHERKAAQMREQQPSAEVKWDDCAEEVDTALAKLGESERSAVAMRYLCGLSLREVGEQMGISEEAARKRVERALVRLRKIMARRVAVPTVAGLGTALAAHGSEAMAASLPATIAAGATGSATTNALAIAKGLWHAMAWAKVKLLVVLLLAGGVAVAAADKAMTPAKTLAPAAAPATTRPGDAETRKLAAKIADAMDAQIARTSRLSYAFKREQGKPTDEDVKAERMGAEDGQSRPTEGEFGWDKATGREYGKVVRDADNLAKRYAEEFGGVPGQWTTIRHVEPGSTQRWARITASRQIIGVPELVTGYLRFGESTIPDMIRAAIDIQITREMRDGEECYRVAMVTQVRRPMGSENAAVGNSIEPHCFWLSIEHGLLPIRCEEYSIANSPPHGSPDTVAWFVRKEYLFSVAIQRQPKQMTNGVWLPHEVLCYTFGHDFKWSTRITITDAAVNEAATVKTLVIPPEAMKGLLKDMLRGK